MKTVTTCMRCKQKVYEFLYETGDECGCECQNTIMADFRPELWVDKTIVTPGAVPNWVEVLGDGAKGTCVFRVQVWHPGYWAAVLRYLWAHRQYINGPLHSLKESVLLDWYDRRLGA